MALGLNSSSLPHCVVFQSLEWRRACHEHRQEHFKVHAGGGAPTEANLATEHDWRETGGGNEPVGVCSQRVVADRCLLLVVACFQSRDQKLGGQDLLIQGLDAWTRTLTFLVRGHQSRSSSMLLKENRRRSR